MRYFFAQDNDSHWYMVPVDNRKEWEEWCRIPEEDDSSWLVPSWAVPLDGSPSLVTFTNPQGV